MSVALASEPTLNVEEIRRDFPILSALGENGRPVIYLDNAASTQRPRQASPRVAAIRTPITSAASRTSRKTMIRLESNVYSFTTITPWAVAW